MYKVIVLLFGVSILIAGCTKENNTKQNNKIEHSGHATPKAEKVDSSIIRTKGINAASLDKNGDGKLYECPMDYEVISDHPGNCPLCGMKLEAYSVHEAASNIKKYFNM